ncbi:MAG: nuclear transport factor 2 family protein [Crocinitomicaceae bacterium]|nr:nuclear transport factor 2 family protein [Crocinitomicaceae bacterium]
MNRILRTNKLKILFALAILLATSCASSQDESIVKSYFKAYNSKDYDKLNTLLADDVLVIDMGYIVLNSKEEFIDMVEWGKVLKGKNKIHSITNKSGEIVVTESQTNDRILFFGEKPVKMNTTFTVKHNVITKIDVEVLNLDQSKNYSISRAFYAWAKTANSIDGNLMNQLNRAGGLELLNLRLQKAMRLFKQK